MIDNMSIFWMFHILCILIVIYKVRVRIYGISIYDRFHKFIKMNDLQAHLNECKKWFNICSPKNSKYVFLEIYMNG